MKNARDEILSTLNEKGIGGEIEASFGWASRIIAQKQTENARITIHIGSPYPSIYNIDWIITVNNKGYKGI